MNLALTEGALLPFYQQVLILLFAPPIVATIFCLRMKILGKEFGIPKTRLIRNTTDWVAFLSFSIAGYVVLISIMIFAHYWRH